MEIYRLDLLFLRKIIILLSILLIMFSLLNIGGIYLGYVIPGKSVAVYACKVFYGRAVLSNGSILRIYLTRVCDKEGVGPRYLVVLRNNSIVDIQYIAPLFKQREVFRGAISINTTLLGIDPRRDRIDIVIIYVDRDRSYKYDTLKVIKTK